MGYTRHMQSLEGVADVGSAVGAVIADPCLLQVAKLTNELAALTKTSASSTPVKGIGLCKAVGPLEMVIYVKKRPWLIPLGASAFVLGLLGLGYVLGSTSKRKT